MENRKVFFRGSYVLLPNSKKHCLFFQEVFHPTKQTSKASALTPAQATFQFNGGTSNGQRDMIPSGQAAYTLSKVPETRNSS